MDLIMIMILSNKDLYLFIVLAENTEKYITFKVLVEKEVTRIDRNKKEIPKNIAIFMASSL